MTVDPILALESLGYTEREASFLYLVAVHSGYFLRRQFDYFIDRNKGSIVMRFLEKARVAGHIQLLDTTHRRQVYHLFYKPIYRLIGAPDSQNRRVKGDADVRVKLMKLDYVLENDHERYLESAQEKLEYFAGARGIDPQIFTAESGCLLPEMQSTLISLVDRAQPASSLVRFIFVDEGLLTITKFQRVLTAMDALLRSVTYFELIYVATSDHNFREAAAFFRRKFAIGAERRQEPLNPEWRNTARNHPQSALPLRPEFTTLLLRFSYPALQRNELHGSRQGSELTRRTTYDTNSYGKTRVNRGRERPRPHGLPLTLVAPAPGPSRYGVRPKSVPDLDRGGTEQVQTEAATAVREGERHEQAEDRTRR